MKAVLVTLNVKTGHLEAFAAASAANARGSTGTEPGCLRFDVLQDASLAGRFYLYEVYEDGAAESTHLETAHFETWMRTVEPMLDGPMEILPLETVFPSDEGWRAQKAPLARG